MAADLSRHDNRYQYANVWPVSPIRAAALLASTNVYGNSEQDPHSSEPNAQTTRPMTDRVKRAAQAHSIPVVPVTETTPQRTHYVAWMTANPDVVDRALGIS